jgi:hypothetical protein
MTPSRAPWDASHAGCELLRLEDNGEVHEYDMILSHGEVVHHGRGGDFNLFALYQRALWADAVIGQKWWQRAVSKCQHFTGLGADLRVCGERRREFAVEIKRPHGIEFAVEFCGIRRFDQG